MKKQTLITIVIGAAALLGGIYLYKRFQKKQESDNQESNLIEGLDTPPQSGSEAPAPITNPLAAAVSFLSNWNDYTVNTQTTALNIRQKPDSKSKVIGSLKKGSVIKGKASGTKDWFAVSRDGKTTIGYVASEYLKANPVK